MANEFQTVPMPDWVRDHFRQMAAGESNPSTSATDPDPLEQERLRCEAANRLPGSLTGMDCPVCQNRGYLMVLSDEGYRVTRPCSCMSRRRAILRMEASGLQDTLDRYTFGSWQSPDRWQAKALEAAKSYAADPQGWFVVTGRSGTGKTHLCTAICSELLQRGLDVRYMLWRDVAVRAKALVTDADGYEQIVGPLKSVKVLYIDDLFKTGRNNDGGYVRPTAGDINLAFEIINSRYVDSRKITLISSEISLDNIMSMDEATGGRIYEETKRGAYLNLADRPNWRMR